MKHITRDEFIRRFKAYMLDKIGPKDSNGRDVAKYAEETAQHSWDDGFFRSWGPEACAEDDLRCWER